MFFHSIDVAVSGRPFHPCAWAACRLAETHHCFHFDHCSSEHHSTEARDLPGGAMTAQQPDMLHDFRSLTAREHVPKMLFCVKGAWADNV
jgi:hypothetical protein